ncbi:MAG: hypothetical protein HYY94_03320 [Gemmatimonadetes bacterium]|nr:hypothetical protein [Gemmatimonadota bacterium]
MLLFCCALSLTACARGGEQAGGEAAALNLADVAGKWTVQGMAEGSDSVLITYEVNATATTEGWTIVLPGRDPMALHVTTGGDSVVTHVGPFESVLRPGTQVTTESVMRLVNGQLEGTVVAHYQTAGADSVVRLRQRGTRAQ